MSRRITALLLALLFVPIYALTPEVYPPSLSQKSCTPDPGYKWCYYHTYTYGDATATAKIQVSDFYDVSGTYRNPFVKFIAQKVSCNGDLYVYRGISSWDDVHCGQYGCDGTLVLSGEYVIAEAPSRDPPGVAYVCYVKKTTEKYWVYVWTGLAWFDRLNGFTVVRCASDSDCNEGYLAICDKSGDPLQWSCKRVECITNDDVPSPKPSTDPYCLNNKVVAQNYTVYTCTNYKITASETVRKIKTCPILCLNGKCLTEDTTTLAILGISLAIILSSILFALVVYFGKR